MVGDKELDTGFRCWSCKEFTTLRARIAELEARIVWLECEAQVNAAPVSEAKAQDTVGEVVGWYRLDRPYEMTSYPSVCATWHKLGAPVAPLYAAPVQQAEYGDAYQGAREDLAIWKRRTLEAEEKVRQQEQIIDHLTSEAQGESRFGEPVVTAGEPCVPDGYVLADKKSLGMVLQALVNAPHHIRELQATRQPVELFSDNPINVLIANYEAPAAPAAPAADAGLVDALEMIINPIEAMRRELQEGEQLNGMVAMQLASDPEYLRGVAKAALAAHRAKGVV